MVRVSPSTVPRPLSASSSALRTSSKKDVESTTVTRVSSAKDGSSWALAWCLLSSAVSTPSLAVAANASATDAGSEMPVDSMSR